MKLTKLVWKELFERKSQVVTGLLAILLGITVIVAIKNITFYSEKAVSSGWVLDALGRQPRLLGRHFARHCTAISALLKTIEVAEGLLVTGLHRNRAKSPRHENPTD